MTRSLKTILTALAITVSSGLIAQEDNRLRVFIAYNPGQSSQESASEGGVTESADNLWLTTFSLPDGEVASTYSLTMGLGVTPADFDLGPVTWSGTGLPAGLSLDTGGNLTGTPSESGTFPDSTGLSVAGIHRRSPT